MTDKEWSEKRAASPKPPPIEELRQMVRDDIEEQRKMIDHLRRKMN